MGYTTYNTINRNVTCYTVIGNIITVSFIMILKIPKDVKYSNILVAYRF